MTQILKITETGELEKSYAEYFEPFRKQAEEWKGKADQIKVTDGSQTDLMKAAKEARLALRDIRVAGQEKHDELKERALREGQAIDRVWRDIKGLIEPIEEQLKEQEKFVEKQEEARRVKLFNERLAILKPYLGEEATKIPLADFTQAVFDNMVLGYQMAQEQKQNEAANLKVQQEKDRAERERLAAENKKLQEDQQRLTGRINGVMALGLTWDEHYKSYVGERGMNIGMVELQSMTTEEFQPVYIRLKAVAAEIAKEKADKVKAERDERDRLNKLEAERQIAERNKIAAEKRAARAPDRVKLSMLSSDIYQFKVPEVKSPEAQVIINGVKDMLNKIGKYIDKQTDYL